MSVALSVLCQYSVARVSVVSQSVARGCRATMSVLYQWSVGLSVDSKVHAQRSVLECHAYTIIARTHHFVGRCGRSSGEVAYRRLACCRPGLT